MAENRERTLPETEPSGYTEDERRTSFASEDARWAPREQAKDWAILLAMILVSLAYHLVIFAFQPGLR